MGMIVDAVPRFLYARLLAHYDQNRRLVIGSPAMLEALPDELVGQAPVALHGAFDPVRELAADSRYDLALVFDAPAILAPAPTRQLLARLRDYHAGAVIAVFAATDTPSHRVWTRSEFIALGFRRLARRDEVPGWRLYGYDIHDYKHTPDWLNARHWANPEQWGRHRW